MAAMTDQQRTEAARELARRIYHALNKTANLNLADLKAAIAALDDGMESLVSSHAGTDTLEVALNKLLPDPFKSTATQAQKAFALAVMAMKRYGVL